MLIVMKFGGSSLADAQRVKTVARRILRQRDLGAQVVAVVSAQGDTTDLLVRKSGEITDHPDAREQDVLLSTGEQMSMALLAMELQKQECPACTLCGWQAGIYTDSCHGDAGILRVDAQRIRRELDADKVVIVAGFQGVDEQGDITTLGRGGSDTSAVALAAALKADLCRIYTDVEGVYSADPRVIPEACCYEQISYATMEAMAALGAKVLHPRAVELAKVYAVPLQVCSSFSGGEGTKVTRDPLERYISGVVGDKPICVVTLSGVAGGAQAAQILTALHRACIRTDVILLSQGDQVCFSAPIGERENICRILQEMKGLFAQAEVSRRMVKLSLVGRDLRDPLGAAAQTAELLTANGIPVPYITSGDRMISLIVEEEHAQTGIRLLHDAWIQRDSMAQEA